MMKVVVLKDNKAGHYNQSLAVAKAIQEVYKDVQVEIYTIKVYRFSKYLLRFMLNNTFFRDLLSNRDSLKFIKLFYKVDKHLDKADVIISSGKDTSMLNIWLKLVYNAKSIYIGHPKKLDYKLFDIIFSVLDLGFENQIVLNVAPTLSYNGDIQEFYDEYKLDSNATYYTLLIGGDGSGYHYSVEEYDKLIDFVNKTSDDIKWLITTSRRTSLEIEKKLQQEMNCEVFIAYNQNPQKVVGTFLSISDIVFVTQESASMISEAIAFAKKVVTLYPKNKIDDDNYKRILNNFSQKKLIYMQDINTLDKFDIHKIELKPLNQSSIDELSEKLKGIL